MSYNPNRHHRRSIRLKGYDYSHTGVYFITLCTYDRECLFGEIVRGTMQLNKFGEIVAEEWLKSVEIRQEIELDNWVIMPNHFHAIVIIDRAISDRGECNSPESSDSSKSDKIQMRPRSLSSLVTGFKSSVTRRINQNRNHSDCPVWQRNYYDHIVRDTDSWEKIFNYIDANPSNWEIDRLHPAHPNPF
jgi:putative transposase